jgi:predicted transcriptional regulator
LNRSGIELRGDVLSQIKNGIDTPSRISYSVNCNWQQLRLFLSEFVDQGLVVCLVEGETSRKKKRYVITLKGEEVLSCVDNFRRLVGVENGV